MAYVYDPEAKERRKKKVRKIIIRCIVGILVFILINLVFAAGFVFLLFSYMNNHDSTHVARQYIEARTDIYDAIGNVESYGRIISGSISNVNGRGIADLRFVVHGQNGRVRADISLVRERGADWEVVSFRFR